MTIKIEYSGAFPNLCSGHLVVTVDGQEWDFGEHCLSSGGTVWFDDSGNEHVETGEWSVTKWPAGFPVALVMERVTVAINDQIPHGCCGGCV
jgi:hypothetical protein